jgi:hypothetical protein
MSNNKDLNMKEPTVLSLCLILPLLALLSGCASFELRSTPDGATVYENGDFMATTPYKFTLFSDVRKFTIIKEGYVETSVSISPLDLKYIDVKLQEVKKTSVNTVPPGAIVRRSADDIKLGTTSLELRLSKPLSIVLKKEGYETVTMMAEPNQFYRVKLKALEGFREIRFSSSPPGVSVSNRAIGDTIAQTPSTLTAEEGTEFDFKMEGFLPQTVLVNKRTPGHMHIEMVPISVVTIVSEEGAAIFRPGGSEKVGDVPFRQQMAIDGIYEVRKDGYYPEMVAVSAASSATYTVPLSKIPYKEIKTTPEGAEIFRFGRRELLGTSPLKLLVETERLIEVGKEGYEPQVLSIGADSPENIEVQLEQKSERKLVVDGVLWGAVKAF